MKKRGLLYFLVAISFVLNSCKEEAKNEIAEDNAISSDSLTKDTSVEEKRAAEQKYYVIAPSGLSLRKDNNLQSEKLLGMLLGSEVLLLEAAATNEIEVEHIKGGMHKISYNGQTGYAFSGYLSPIHLPKQNQATEDYLADLKEEFPEVRFKSKANDPDFHEGTTDTFTLPATSWHEAFYIVSAMYQLPKSLGFPNPSGPEQTVTEDTKKPKDAWDSFLTATRKNNSLEKIEYSYRAEGFGYTVTITRPTDTGFAVEYLGFVD